VNLIPKFKEFAPGYFFIHPASPILLDDERTRDNIIEVIKESRRLFGDPIKFNRREVTLSVPPLAPGIWEISLHRQSMSLITRMGEENDSHFAPFDLFSANTKIDLVKSMPRYRWRGTIT
jgi:hypothetical protein